jgi:hypothetical protein
MSTQDEYEKQINADLYTVLAAALRKLGEQKVKSKVYLFPNEANVYRETLEIAKGFFAEYETSRDGQRRCRCSSDS